MREHLQEGRGRRLQNHTHMETHLSWSLILFVRILPVECLKREVGWPSDCTSLAGIANQLLQALKIKTILNPCPPPPPQKCCPGVLFRVEEVKVKSRFVVLPDCVRKEETNEKTSMHLLMFKKKRKMEGLITSITNKSVPLAGRVVGSWPEMAPRSVSCFILFTLGHCQCFL